MANGAEQPEYICLISNYNRLQNKKIKKDSSKIGALSDMYEKTI